ncbi:MAG: radical SAM protein [Candidatus Coatesbacteria bacterium]|nr:MAG: radical SAM protein [Candidatus Coatesbacteria bacterium]
MGVREKVREFMLEQSINRMADLACKGDPDKSLRRIIKLGEKITTDPLWVDAISGFKHRLEINHPLMAIARRFLKEFNPTVRRRLLTNLIVKEALIGADKRHKIEEEIGFYPPTLLVLSPTMRCNITCTGCYAAQYSKKYEMEPELIDRIFTEAKEMGIHLIVISGGEPLFHPDMLDLIEKHSDIGFQMYTNGTLIDEKMAKRIGKMGNLVPCISLEGLKEETDKRRGDGVFEKCSEAFDHMRKEGICFGFSATCTRYNLDAITSPEFIDFVERKGCTLGWYFTYIPIGREPDTSLMPTPAQRYTMGARIRRIRETRTVFAADFWNDGPHVDGCIMGGKRYFHINVHGDVEPCVFAQFTVDNVRDKPLVECLRSDFFRQFRNRQPFSKDLRRPCAIIDNPEVLRECVKLGHARPSYDANLKLVTELAEDLDAYAGKFEAEVDAYSRKYDGDPYCEFGTVEQTGWVPPSHEKERARTKS